MHCKMLMYFSTVPPTAFAIPDHGINLENTVIDRQQSEQQSYQSYSIYEYRQVIHHSSKHTENTVTSYHSVWCTKNEGSGTSRIKFECPEIEQAAPNIESKESRDSTIALIARDTDGKGFEIKILGSRK